MKHTISVIVRTHNSEQYLKRCLQSIFNQTIPRTYYEIIVVDDGSTDGTRNLLKVFQSKIKIIEKENLGAIKAINVGLQHASGEYVILLDADDAFEPTILEKMHNVLQYDEKVIFVYSDYFEYFQNSGERKVVSLSKNIFNSLAGGILIRKSILEEFGGYDETLVFPEYDLLIKLINNNYEGKYIKDPLFTYTRHQDSITANEEIVKVGKQQLIDRFGKKIKIRNY